MSTPRPDAASQPVGAEETVRLAPAGPGGVEETVRLAPADAGAAEQTVRLAPAGPGDAEQTVRLAPAAAGAAEETVRLAPPGAGAAGVDLEATVRLDGAEPASATFLDPRVWGAPAEPGETLPTTPTGAAPAAPGAVAPVAGVPVPVATATLGTTLVEDGRDEQPLTSGEQLRRFGPGVPPQAAAVWHGEAVPVEEPPRKRRRVGRWLVPVAVLLAVLALLYWRFSAPALAVTGVAVSTDPAGPGCGGTAVVTAAVDTNGGAGPLRYRWVRSDGTTSGELVQDVRSGTHRTDLVLRWSFDGRGELQNTATLEILSPGTRTSSTTFAYHCA
ncbi:hypothetical protein ACWGB8_27300 [Kitasatospora sp. NPDC054939]